MSSMNNLDLANTTGIQKVSPEAYLSILQKADEGSAATETSKIIAEAKRYNLGLKDWLRLKLEPVVDDKGSVVMNGYERALKFMNLPVKDDFDSGVSLRAASDTFYTVPGSRLLFPEVVLDMVKWKTNLDEIVTSAAIVAQTRTVAGTNEMIMTELDKDEVDAFNVFQIAEGGEIPIRKIKSSSRSVRFFKLGAGYEITYEFARRVTIDILTPYVNRINRQFEIDKVRYVTAILMNGDGVNGAISSDAETAYGGTNGSLEWKALSKWLMDRAIAGYPVDTLVMNYATYADYLNLFTPVAGGGQPSLPESMSGKGGPALNPRAAILNGAVNVAISHSAAASTIIGITKGETIEELVEAGSDIVENERIITNQTIRFTRTQNIGYNLVTPGARRAFVYAT